MPITSSSSNKTLWIVIGSMAIILIVDIIIFLIIHHKSKTTGATNSQPCPNLNCGQNGTLITIPNSKCQICACDLGTSGTNCENGIPTPVPYNFQWSFDNPTNSGIGNFHAGNSATSGQCLYVQGNQWAYTESCDIVKQNNWYWTIATPSGNPDTPSNLTNVNFIIASPNGSSSSSCLESNNCYSTGETCTGESRPNWCNSLYWCTNCNVDLHDCSTSSNPYWIYDPILGTLQHVGTGYCLTWGNGGVGSTGTQVNLQPCPAQVAPPPTFKNSQCQNQSL